MSTIDLELGTQTPGLPPNATRRSPGAEKRIPEIVYSVSAVVLLLVVWFALSHAMSTGTRWLGCSTLQARRCASMFHWTIPRVPITRWPACATR